MKKKTNLSMFVFSFIMVAVIAISVVSAIKFNNTTTFVDDDATTLNLLTNNLTNSGQESTNNGADASSSEAESVNVTFVCEYMERETQSVFASSEITNTPELPTNVLGCEFEGWYTDEDCTTKADLTKGFSEDITLYAKKNYKKTDWICYNYGSETYCVVAGNDEISKDVIVPRTYDDGRKGEGNITVIMPASESSTRLYYGAFTQNKKIESITIPNTITRVGYYAFWGCENLKNVYFEEGANILGFDYGAFSDCTSLEYINIPKTVTSVCGGAFSGCTNLKSVEFEDITTWYSNGKYFNPSELQNREKAAELLVETAFSTMGNWTLVDDDSLITFDANGGSFSESQDSDGYYFGRGEALSSTEVTTFENIEAEGNNGFIINSDGQFESVSVDTSLSYSLCKIPFEANVGDIVQIDLKKYFGGSWCYAIIGEIDKELSASAVEDTENVYKDLRGVIPANNPGETTVEITVTTSGEHFIYVKYIKSQNFVASFKVQFDLTVVSYDEDMSILNIEMAEDETFESMPIPTRDGYVFTGWYTESIGGEMVDKEKFIIYPTTLYAHWVEE